MLRMPQKAEVLATQLEPYGFEPERHTPTGVTQSVYTRP